MSEMDRARGKRGREGGRAVIICPLPNHNIEIPQLPPSSFPVSHFCPCFRRTQLKSRGLLCMASLGLSQLLSWFTFLNWPMNYGYPSLFPYIHSSSKCPFFILRDKGHIKDHAGFSNSHIVISRGLWFKKIDLTIYLYHQNLLTFFFMHPFRFSWLNVLGLEEWKD